MRSDRPPTLAKWLLRHFGSSPNNESVIGDLDERYRRGRSRLWYWQQALHAIVTDFFQELWAHKLLAIRGLFLGWLIKAAWLWLASLVVVFTACNNPNNPDACRMLGDWHWQWFLPLLLASVTASVAVCIMSVRLVSRISGPHYRSMVLLYVLVEVLAVPIRLLGPANQIPPMIAEVPGGFTLLWASPFATYFYVGLAKVGYPFETVIALWCGTILMAVTMLWGGCIFNASASFPLQQQRSTGLL